jgi:predicted dienelactone hydrolase
MTRLRPELRRVRLAAALIAVVLLAAACGSGDDTSSGDSSDNASADTSTTAPSTDAGELADAGAPGPYAVGLRTVTVTDTGDAARSFSVDVWYPVDPDATSGVANAEYSFIPGLGYTSERSFADAPPAEGPFPLVVYSHGSGGFRWVATFFTEFLASKGFVVAAPDHTGNTAIDSFTGASVDSPTNANNRPDDITDTIDAVLAASNDPDDVLAGRVDDSRIGLTGHSFGGFTALASVSGHTNAVGTTIPDPRITAVVVMAPYTLLLSDDELAAVDVPTMMISATDDLTTPIATNTERPWELISGRPLVRIDITAAAHNSFTDLCQLRTAVAQLPDVPEAILGALDAQAGQACSDAVLDSVEVHRITNAYAAAFLIDELTGSRTYAAALECASPPPEVACDVRS